MTPETRTTLTELQEAVFENAASKGFHDADDEPNRFAVYIANLHGEISELWEAYRKGELNKACDKSSKMRESLTCFEEEIADIIIRAMDTAQGGGVNVARAIDIKMQYNATRPHMHGKIARCDRCGGELNAEPCTCEGCRNRIVKSGIFVQPVMADTHTEPAQGTPASIE